MVYYQCGVISGSLLPGTNVTINSSSDGFFISSSAAGGGANDATITLTAGSGLDGGGAFTLNQSGNEEITFTVSDGVVSGSFSNKCYKCYRRYYKSLTLN